jgi:hypothetical protein
MAELDPEKVGRSGVDPVTGSPLSQEVRTALLRKSTIDASVFQNIENRRAQTDAQNAELSRGQNEALIGFNSTLQAIRTDIVKLGTGLSGIALLLQQDATEDQSKVRVDQEKERRLAERQIRIGKENEIEQKIQNAVTEPVQRLVPKVNDIFGRIGAALGILFGGWLTNQTVQAIKASEEGNTKLFNDIRFNILKNVGIAVGGLFAIRAGFSLIKRTIGGIASGLIKLLIAKPLALAASLIPRPGGGPKPGGPKPSTNTGSRVGSGLNVRGNLAVGALMTGLDIAGGEDPIRAAAGAAGGMITSAAAFGLGSLIPFPGTGVISGALAYGPGQEYVKGIYDKFFGKTETNNETLKKENLKESPKPAVESTPPSTVVAPAPAPAPSPPAQPQTPMMGEQKPSTPPPSPDMEKKFEQAWQNRNNPLVRDRIEGAWNKMTPDQQQQAKTWASSKGYDWNEMRLKDSANMNQTTKSESAEITPAQMTTPPKEPQQVGQLPEPKPSLTMIKTSSAQQQQPNPPLTNGALTDVPLINSANPDNFYVLYSQLNYNVVM